VSYCAYAEEIAGMRNVNSVEMLKLSSQKTVLVLMHIRSIQISVLLKHSGDGHVQKSIAFNLCLST